MGEFTIKKWRCDRCGKTEDNRPRLDATYTLTASEDFGTAGGQSIGWRELCYPCSMYVFKTIECLLREAEAAQAQEQENGR